MNSKLKRKIITSQRVSVYNTLLDLVTTNSSNGSISFPGVTSSFNSTSTGSSTIPLYVACNNEKIVFKNSSDSFVITINSGVNASFSYVNDGNWYITTNSQPGNSGLFDSDTVLIGTGDFSEGSSLPSSNQQVLIGNFSVNGSHQSYQPVENAVPFVVVNGQALISWSDYCNSLPDASEFASAAQQQFKSIQLSTDPNLRNLITKYIQILNNQSPSFNVFLLINELTSITDSQGVQMYNLNQISYYKEELLLTSQSSVGFSSDSYTITPNPASFVLCQFTNSNSIPQDMQDAYASIPLVWRYEWNSANNNNMLNYFSDSIAYMSLGVYSVENSFSSTTTLTVASGVNSSKEFAPTWVMLNANSGQIWDYNPVLPNGNALEIPGGSGVCSTSIPSAFNLQPWANSGNTYWQTFGNSVNTSYAYVGYYFNGNASPVDLDSEGQVVAAEGTIPLIAPTTGSATYFYWSNANNQSGAGGIWAETSDTYSNYPNLYLQYYAIIPNSNINNVSFMNDDNWDINPQFSYQVQEVGSSNITVPVLYINLTSSGKTVSSLTSTSTSSGSQLEEMSDYYKKISETLESHLLTSHNAKLLFAGTVDNLVSTVGSINSSNNPNSTNSNSTEQFFSLYCLLALVAVGNGSLTKFISTVVSGYPFSSVPGYFNSLMLLINNTYNMSFELTPSVLNKAISTFFSMESPTSVTAMVNSGELPEDSTQSQKIKSTYTSSSGVTYTILNGLSIESIQEIMFIISKGMALSEFSQSAASFISHIYSYITSEGTDPSESQLDNLKQQWSQITQNWNKVGDTHSISNDSYCFIPSTNSVLAGLRQEFADINQIVTSAFYFSASKSNISARLSQLMYNQHKTHSSLITQFISYISEELLGFNSWSTLGDSTLHLIIGSVDVGFSLLKFIGRITERILAGVGSLTSPGSVVANIYSNSNKLLPDAMANYPNFEWVNNITTLNNDVKEALKNINLLTFSLPNPKINTSDSSCSFPQDSSIPISIGKVNRLTLNTPIGEVYFWLDSQFGANGQGLLNISNGSDIQSFGFDVPPEIKIDGTVSELRTLRKLLDFFFNFPVLLMPNSKDVTDSENSTGNQISSFIKQLYSSISTTPGFSNLTQHISYGELAAVTGADAVAITAYAAAAVNAGFDLDFTKAIGYGILGVADAVAMAKFIYQFEEDEVANVADAFYYLGNTITSYSNFIKSLCTVDSNLNNYKFTFSSYDTNNPTSSLFSWQYSATQPAGRPCSVGNLINGLSKFNQVSDLSLMNGDSISSGQQVSINLFNPIYSTYSVSKLYVSEQAAIAVGKFALSNYVINRLINKIDSHKIKVAQNDTKGSKLTNKTLFETYAIKKYQRIVNGKKRMTALNNQTGVLGNDVQQVQNSLSNEIGSSINDLVDGLSLIRGAN